MIAELNPVVVSVSAGTLEGASVVRVVGVRGDVSSRSEADAAEILLSLASKFIGTVIGGTQP
jgi:hypothetical protein